MKHPSATEASPETKRIIKMGKQVSRAQAYHSTYECKSLAGARRRVKQAGTWLSERQRPRGFRELTAAQAAARGLHACPWCHGVKPGPRASSKDLPGRMEIRQLVWPESLRHALAEAVSGTGVKA